VLVEYRPDLVAGDFNAPRRSRAISPLPAGFAHAYDLAGCGWSYTWPVICPLYAIDQCIVSNSVRPIRYELGASSTATTCCSRWSSSSSHAFRSRRTDAHPPSASAQRAEGAGDRLRSSSARAASASALRRFPLAAMHELAIAVGLPVRLVELDRLVQVAERLRQSVGLGVRRTAAGVGIVSQAIDLDRLGVVPDGVLVFAGASVDARRLIRATTSPGFPAKRLAEVDHRRVVVSIRSDA